MKQKALKISKTLREAVDFETWKANLATLLQHRSPELDAFEEWIRHHSVYFAQIGRSDLTSTAALLEVAFQLTQPEVSSRAEWRKYEAAAKKLRELLPEIESAIGALTSTHSGLVPKDGLPGRRADKLKCSLEAAANHIRWALIFTDRPYMRHADVVSYCTTFLASIYLCEVREEDALALTALLMKAHGFSDEDVIVFGKAAVDSGLIRKRIQAYIKAHRDIADAQREFLEQQRNRKRGEVRVLSLKLMELLKADTTSAV